jgi:AbrB family looped-hinge helix DNA binding protein
MSVLSKLTAKGQTTIPRKVRQKLELKPGDLIVFEIHGDVVQLRKVEPWMSVISAPSKRRFRSGNRLRTLKRTMIFESLRRGGGQLPIRRCPEGQTEASLDPVLLGVQPS